MLRLLYNIYVYCSFFTVCDIYESQYCPVKNGIYNIPVTTFALLTVDSDLCFRACKQTYLVVNILTT